MTPEQRWLWRLRHPAMALVLTLIIGLGIWRDGMTGSALFTLACAVASGICWGVIIGADVMYWLLDRRTD